MQFQDNAGETKKMQTNRPGLPYAVVTGGHICKALLPCGVIQEEVHLAEKRNVKRFPGRPKDGVSMLELSRILMDVLPYSNYLENMIAVHPLSKTFKQASLWLQDWIHHVLSGALILDHTEDFPVGYISSYCPPKPLHASLTKLEKLPSIVRSCTINA